MRNLFAINGVEVRHSIFGATMGEPLNVVGYISDFNLTKIGDKANSKCEISVENIVDLKEKKIKIGNTRVVVVNYRPITKKEERMYDKVLREKNLVFEERVLERLWVGGTIFEKKLGLFYINKDDFVIRIGDKVNTYKELKEKKFCEDDNIVLSGDDGFSHVWESTTKANDVFAFVERLFGEPTFSFSNQARAHFGEHCGFNFNKCGELVLRVTKNKYSFSEVSFS